MQEKLLSYDLAYHYYKIKVETCVKGQMVSKTKVQRKGWVGGVHKTRGIHHGPAQPPKVLKYNFWLPVC